MSRRHRLEQLLRDPRVWKAGRQVPCGRVVATGLTELDAALGGGWPAGCLTELLVERYGVGEFGLLLPTLSDVSGAGGWVALVAPPYIPYAPAFDRHGLDPSRVLVVHCHRRKDVLWAVEQALQSRACAAVLAWSDAADERALRRLQLAAETDGAVLLVLFRPGRLVRQRSPAALRVRLQPGPGGALALEIIKHRGGRPRAVIVRAEAAGSVQ